MNKKGFLKILEAIIAIIIVLGFVIAVIPNKQVTTTRIPPALEETTNSFLTEMRNNPEFREKVLDGDADYAKGYIDFLATPVAAHPWDYSLKICKVNSTSDVLGCNYSPDVDGETWQIKDTNFINMILPKDRDVYTKSTTLSSPDVSGQDPLVVDGNYSLLILYAWSKG